MLDFCWMRQGGGCGIKVDFLYYLWSLWSFSKGLIHQEGFLVIRYFFWHFFGPGTFIADILSVFSVLRNFAAILKVPLSCYQHSYY